MPRAVLDPNVLISALISPDGASAQLLLKLRDGFFEMVVSPMLLGELSDVLRRDKFRRYASELEVDEYVQLIRRESVVIDDPEPSRDLLRADPDDQYIIDLARVARVDAIVSGDTHLLDLRHVVPAKSPREFLDSLSAP